MKIINCANSCTDKSILRTLSKYQLLDGQGHMTVSCSQSPPEIGIRDMQIQMS